MQMERVLRITADVAVQRRRNKFEAIHAQQAGRRQVGIENRSFFVQFEVTDG